MTTTSVKTVEAKLTQSEPTFKGYDQEKAQSMATLMETTRNRFTAAERRALYLELIDGGREITSF